MSRLAALGQFALLPGFLLPLEAQSPPEWQFVQRIRIGSLNDDATGFSDVRAVLADRKGNIWVLEASTQDIRVFDSTGKHLRTIGRKGKGPGEFIYADGMAQGPDGLIWVHDPQNGRFSIFNEAGEFVRQQLAPAGGYGFVWNGGIDRSGRIWDFIFYRVPNDPLGTRMRRASPDWTRVDTLVIPRCSPGYKPEEGIYRFPQGTMSIPYYPAPVSAMDYAGSAVWCAPTSAEYRLVKVGIERPDTTARIAARVPRIPVSGAERDSAVARVRRFMERAGPISPDWSRIPSYKPVIRLPFVDLEGRLWVGRETSGKGAHFDIYSSQGAPLGTVRVEHAVNLYIRPAIRGNVAWFLARDEDDVPYLVGGRLVPGR